jgi:activating signal cointegrator 1
VKAISLWQPWASLIAAGVKEVETRHWFTPYRGPIAIHAAKRLESDCGEELDELCLEEFGCHWRTSLPRGAIVATAELVACERMFEKVYPTIGGYPSAREFICGNWQQGRFAWLLNAVKPLKPPVPYRGMQGLFDIDGSAVSGDTGK